MNELEAPYKRYGWRENPFTLEIKPELFVGYHQQINMILSSIRENQKHLLLLGPTGAGKTTTLFWIKSQIERDNNVLMVYLPKPPTKEQQIIDIFKSIVDTGVFGRIYNGLFRKDLSIYTVSDYVSKRIRNKKLVLIIDEAHETRMNILEWFRTIIDQIPGATLLLSGLPKLKDEQLSSLETLKQRIMNMVELDSLDKNETFQLIKKRVESVGGKGVEPFTIEAVNKIYEITAGFPRETLKLCNSLIYRAFQQNSEIIDLSFFDDFEEDKEEGKISVEIKDKMDMLTDKQREILIFVSKKEGVTPNDIVENVDISVYKSKIHAIRAINNILKRMEGSELVYRKRSGRSYKYYVFPKIKSFLVDA